MFHQSVRTLSVVILLYTPLWSSFLMGGECCKSKNSEPSSTNGSPALAEAEQSATNQENLSGKLNEMNSVLGAFKKGELNADQAREKLGNDNQTLMANLGLNKNLFNKSDDGSGSFKVNTSVWNQLSEAEKRHTRNVLQGITSDESLLAVFKQGPGRGEGCLYCMIAGSPENKALLGLGSSGQQQPNRTPSASSCPTCPSSGGGSTSGGPGTGGAGAGGPGGGQGGSGGPFSGQFGGPFGGLPYGMPVPGGGPIKPTGSGGGSSNASSSIPSSKTAAIPTTPTFKIATIQLPKPPKEPEIVYIPVTGTLKGGEKRSELVSSLPDQIVKPFIPSSTNAIRTVASESLEGPQARKPKSEIADEATVDDTGNGHYLRSEGED